MNYEQAVEEKKQRLATKVVDTPLETGGTKHEFQQTFYIQDNWEDRKFWIFKYRKLVGKNVIPVGLCRVCDKLEVEHL